MTIVPLGDYRPDAPAYQGTHATVASGVYPKPDGSDGPLKYGVPLAFTLSARPISAHVVRKGNGVVYLYAATAYLSSIRMKSGAAWSVLYSPGGPGVATPLFPWRFAQFGERVLATNPINGLVSHSMGTFDNFAAVAGAPAAAFIATIEPGFVMLGHTSDGSTDYPNRLHWSGLNDSTSWPTVGTSAAAAAQSDVQDLPNGGAVMAILPAVGGVSGAVLTQRSIYRIEYVGAPAIFAFREVVRGIGSMCANGAASVGGSAYFVSEEGFMRFDGQSLAPIGMGRVSATFLAEVDRENLHRVNVAHDPLRKIIVWAYPTSAATDGNPNKWLIYSYATDRWRMADDAAVTCSLLFTAVQDGYPLEYFETYFPGGLDGTPAVSLDGASVNGGAPLLAGFDANFTLVSYAGSNLAARVETGETDAGGRRVFVTGIRPLTDAASVTAAVGYRDGFSGSVAYTTGTALEGTGLCPQRINTRYARARMDIPAGATWSYLQGADVVLKPSGRR